MRLQKQLLLLLSFCFIFSYSLAQEEAIVIVEEIVDCENDLSKTPIIWNIGQAINQALQANRAFLVAQEAIEKADLNIEFEMTEFQWNITPQNRIGFAQEPTHKKHHSNHDDTEETVFTATLGADLCKKWESGTRVTFSPYAFKAKKSGHVGFKALISQPLFKGYGYWYNTTRLQGAKFNYRSAIRNVHVARIKLIVKVVAAMYEIEKQEAIVRFNEASYERLKGYSTAAELKEKIGLSDSLDIYRVQTELHHTEESLAASRERLQEAQDTFRELLALPMEECVQIEVPMIYHEINIDPAEAIQKAIENRIEIDQAYDNIYEQKRLANWSKQNLLPDVNLVAEYQTYKKRCAVPYYVSGLDANGLPCQLPCRRYAWLDREGTWSVGLSSRNDFYQNSEQLYHTNALIALDNAYRNLEQTETTITLEVKRCLRALQQAQKKLEVQEKQIKTAEGELYLSQIKFNHGMANNFDVLQAERNLRSAHIAYLSALIELINGEYQLNHTLGTLADKPCL